METFTGYEQDVTSQNLNINKYVVITNPENNLCNTLL
jgi:hypothetical protein